MPFRFEIPVGAAGFLSTSGQPAKAFATFQTNSSGSQVTWTYKDASGWPGGLTGFKLVYTPAPASPPPLGGLSVVLTNNAFGGDPTAITSMEGLFFTPLDSDGIRFLLQVESSSKLVWFTNSSTPERLSTSTLSFSAAGETPQNPSFYSAVDVEADA